MGNGGSSRRWRRFAAWQGDGLRREAFFFSSGGSALFGSTYGPASGEPRLGVVFCSSWGYEANLAGRFVHPVSIALARAGGVALNFHYPGFGDSGGDFRATTMEAMAASTRDAVREASRRHPDTDWILAGLWLGASVAALAADRVAADRLLLVQPALRPGRYFSRLRRASGRSLGGPAPPPVPGFAYGYPLSEALLESGPADDAAVGAALAGFAGEGTAIRHAEPATIESLPERFEQVTVAGAWRFGARDSSALARATVTWLRGRNEAGG